MGIPDAVQTLSAAFTFGILFQAAAPSILLFTKGHGKAVFKDGRRLVLVLFLLFAALWSQIEFLALMIPTTMTGTCSAAVVTSTALDQLARVMIEQFLLWSVGHGTKITAERLVMQGMLLLRIVAGGLLVGFTRTDFAPTCVPRTSVLPVGIVVLSLDAVIFGVLVARTMSLGVFREMKDKKSSKRQQSRALVFSVIGFGIWTVTSVPMILGIPTLILLLRTVLPGNGLLILASIVAGFSIALLVAKEEDGITPEARSPFMNPMPPSRELFRGTASNTGSPIVGHGYTKSGSLFVVNPSTPNMSPTMFQGTSRNGDTRGFTKLSAEITITSMENAAPVRPERPDRKQASNGPGYRGSSGVFPSMLVQGDDQGAFAPQIRPSICAVTQVGAATTTQQKRSIFNRSKPPPKSNIRGLGISQPISLSTDNSGSQSFAKIPTIDLAAAAKMERDRRDEAAARSQMVASRPAPPAPLGSSQDGLRESTSGTRKGAPYLETKPMPTIPGSTAGSSIDGTNGSTTSASLSPGRDEVRRRSPRYGSGFNQINEKVPIQPTLQRKQTIGLPSNPRSQRAMTDREVGMAKEQTVMLISEIVYDQPGLVKTIINNAPAMYAKHPKTADASTFSADFSLKSSNSIIDRPRPYKKVDASGDRQLFPTEPSPGHKRGKSSSSFIKRKSILRSQPGSPTNLPPLPPPPTTADKLTKLLPNNTKSMTFDEKIQLLFPAPPGPNHLHYRRSSVPSIPRVPSVFMADSPTSSPTSEGQRTGRTSKRTTLASFGFDNPNIATSSPKQNFNAAQERQISHFSATTCRTFTDENNEITVSGLNLLELPTRQSVFNDLRKSHFTETTTSDESSIDDAITDWASIHSKVPAIDLSKVMRSAQPTFIRRAKLRVEDSLTENVPPLPVVLEARATGAIVPLMLDLEEPRRSFLFDASADKETFFLDNGQTIDEDQPTPMERGWHRRIGDELPTFSERMKPRSRKMPPPTPLLLSRNGRQATVIVRKAEPSPPIDSPERAIKEIQEQLKRFEDPNRVSVGSLLERLPNANQGAEYSQDNHRLRLLDNLEMEIGQQENHWQRMQTNLDRDSMSIASPQRDSQLDSVSGESSQRSSRPLSRILDRHSRIQSGLTTRSKSNDSSHGPSTDSSENSRASVWQQRLADAQMEYTTNAPDLLRKRSLNFLSVHKAPAALGSPTPPESVISETDIESESGSGSLDDVIEIQEKAKKPASLWQELIASPKAAAGRLWNHPYESSVAEGPPEPPAKNLRPAQRHTEQPLQIFSVELWSKPRSAEHNRPVVGLWGSKPVRPRSIVTRPVTQRPARKSRRVTFLPDIVESPVPLPNKRETLGIFQFPWGEKSDQPIYQPAFNPILIPGPVLNTQFEARSRELEPEQSDYSTSFFDDYEEEGEDDMMDEDSEDDFDETTLWEIASLLNSSDVPSKQSLLPSTIGIIEDYESDGSETEEGRAEMARARSLQMRLPIQPLEMPSRTSPRSSLQHPSNRMWSPPTHVVEPPSSGLFSKPANSTVIRTTSANPAALLMLKTPRKATGDLPLLASNSLWAPVEAPKQEVVWLTRMNQSELTAPVHVSTLTWSPAERNAEVANVGLFDPSIPRSCYRTTEATPAAINMICKPRKSELSVETLVSTKLWSATQELSIERDWISESSISPVSPSIYSAPSSGASSPVSDASSIKSTSTKASSVSGISAISSWWDNNRSKNAAPSPLVEDGKPGSKIPARQPPKPLAPVRESRVLASRDMWESMAPVLEKNPSKKFCRATITRQPVKLTRQAMRQQYRPSGTFQASWNEALREAIAASRTKPALERDFSMSKIAQPVAVIKTLKVSRPIASKADWNSALTEAISKSHIRVERPQCSPSMWQSALASAVALSIMPQTLTFQRYDAAIMHPVFFTKSFISNITDVHPAAIGHFNLKKNVELTMWKMDTAVSTPEIGLMWTKSILELRHNSSAMAVAAPLIRNALPPKTIDLPVLGSTYLWKLMPVASSERNWLMTSKPTSAQTWTPITSPMVEVESTAMWAVKSTRTAALPDTFSNVRHEHIRARSSGSEALPRLTSTSLFSHAVTVVSETNWLHQTSKQAKSMTWTAPAAALSNPVSQIGMWAPSNQNLAASPDILAHLIHNAIRATPPRSASTHLPVLTSDKLFEVTLVTKANTHWLHQTSKVVARSMTWTASSVAQPSKPETGMWVPTLKSITSSSDLFAGVQRIHIRSAPRSAALSQITSTSLFVPTKSTSDPTHWLHKTSRTAAVTTRKCSTTCTARTPLYLAPEQSTNMWSAKPIIPRSLPSPMLFTNTHTEPWTRPKRSDSAVGGIESTELWQSLADADEDVKNWLVNGTN